MPPNTFGNEAARLMDRASKIDFWRTRQWDTKSNTQIAAEEDVRTETVSRWRNRVAGMAEPGTPRPEYEDSTLVRNLRNRLRVSERVRRKAIDDLEKLRTCRDVADEAREAEPVIVPEGYARKSRSRAYPLLCLSDVHAEKTIDPHMVSQFNEYTADICRERWERTTERFLERIDMWRARHEIRRAGLWLGGDLIDGHIHPELMETSSVSPTQAIRVIQDHSERSIKRILTVCDRVDVHCSHGNHGRTTEKRRIATDGKNSFEWLAYHNLADRFRDDDRVRFTIPVGPLSYASIYGTDIRFHHGHQAGRFTRNALRKQFDSWDRVRPADLTIMGHFHQAMDLGFAAINGSMCGFDSFAQSIGAFPEEPQQIAILIDEHVGKAAFAPLRCAA